MPNTIPTKPTIHVDCMCSHTQSLVPPIFRQTLTTLVNNVKESAIWLSRPEVDHNNDFAKGYRYKDTDRCVDVILGNMRLASQKVINEYNDKDLSDIHYEELSDEVDTHFAHYLTKWNSEELTQWVDACLEYSGGCDHWYTYEKDYGQF